VRVLFLTHRLPYAPNRGDRIRASHLVQTTHEADAQVRQPNEWWRANRSPGSFLDELAASLYTDAMDVNLTPDLEAKLARIAGERGSTSEALVREAIERLIDYDVWFIEEVDKGLAQIERGEILTHEEVGARLEARLADKRPRA
jgi:predicted transcriptional regulator